MYIFTVRYQSLFNCGCKRVAGAPCVLRHIRSSWTRCKNQLKLISICDYHIGHVTGCVHSARRHQSAGHTGRPVPHLWGNPFEGKILKPLSPCQAKLGPDSQSCVPCYYNPYDLTPSNFAILPAKLPDNHPWCHFLKISENFRKFQISHFTPPYLIFPGSWYAEIPPNPIFVRKLIIKFMRSRVSNSRLTSDNSVPLPLSYNHELEPFLVSQVNCSYRASFRVFLCTFVYISMYCYCYTYTKIFYMKFIILYIFFIFIILLHV